MISTTAWLVSLLVPFVGKCINLCVLRSSDSQYHSGLYLPMVTPHLSFTATSAHNGELCKIGNTISFNTKSSTATVVWLLLLLPSLYRLLKWNSNWWHNHRKPTGMFWKKRMKLSYHFWLTLIIIVARSFTNWYNSRSVLCDVLYIFKFWTKRPPSESDVVPASPTYESMNKSEAIHRKRGTTSSNNNVELTEPTKLSATNIGSGF